MTGPLAPPGVLWDTMYASRLRPSRPALLEAALRARDTRHEPLLGAPVVAEVVYGLRRDAATDPRYDEVATWWESHLLAGPNRFRVIVPSVPALVIAARVLALRPTSPAPAKRRDGRRPPERRLSWSRDIELAAIAVTSRLPVATENRSDFEPIADLLTRIAPRLPHLELREAPLPPRP